MLQTNMWDVRYVANNFTECPEIVGNARILRVRYVANIFTRCPENVGKA